MDNLTNLESLSKQLGLEKTLDFIQFRTSFINNYDFERLNELAKTQLIKRTGSRSLTWKMMLGVIPNVNDKELWVKSAKECRTKYSKLQDKYMKLNNQIHTPNPLASLNNPDMAKEIFSMKEDRDVKILIKKDVERTMQELPLFANKAIQQQMEEVLYLWAKEYPEFKYQQGMNEILAVIVICVISEQLKIDNNNNNNHDNDQIKNGKQESDDQESGHSSDDNDYDDENSQDYIKKLFRELHDPQHIWADIYCMFENLMNLGVKELYYKDIIKPQLQQVEQSTTTTKNVVFTDKTIINPLQQQTKDIRTYTQYSSLSSNSTDSSNNTPSQNMQQMSKEKQRRLRKQKLLELNHEDANKTSLKKRSNKIYSSYLREIDPELFKHIQDIDLQPELILLKYLRCMLSREFKAQSVLYVWDFILSGIEEEGRIYLQEMKENKNVADEEEYQKSDFLKNLDYVCLAMIQLQRNYLISSDYIGCLKLTTKSLKLDGGCHSEVVRIADRIGKIIFDKLLKKEGIIQKDEFPRILEQDVEKFMQEYSLRNDTDEDDGEYVDSDEENHNNSAIVKQPNRKCYKVKEESDEEDEELSEQEDSVNDLSLDDRIKDADEVEATMNGLPAKQSSNVGSIVIDEEGDTFVDCKNINLEEDNKSNHDNDDINDNEKDDSFHSIHTDEHLDNSSPQENINSKKLFKLKDTKGKVIYDQQTKQRRFMSPFEQFIAEQEGLFKKDELRQHDEQNSVTLTTTASTQFNDAKTVIHLHSLHSGSGSVIEEPIQLPKKAAQVMKPNNKLAKMANTLQIDAKVKQAEDSVMLERKQNLKQLRNIKGYLTGVKTGKNNAILEKVQRAQRESERKSSFSLSFLFS